MLRKGLACAIYVFLCLSWPGQSGAHAAIFSVVVYKMNPDYEKVLSGVRKEIGESDTLLVFEIAKFNLGDPIKKGDLLSRIAAGELVIPIGDRATEFVSDELEDVPTFFIGASQLSGDYLSSKNVSGILSYSPETLVKLIREIIPGAAQVGMVYTEGYSGIVSDIAAEAEKHGISVVKVSVQQKSEIGPAIRNVFSKSNLIWLPGDPLLVKGAALEFILGESFIRLSPIVGSGVEEVKKGALFCVLPDYDKLSLQAENTFKELIEEVPPLSGKRIEYSTDPGRVAMNASVARKLKVSVPRDLKVTWME